MRMFFGIVVLLLVAFTFGCDPRLDVTAQAPTQSTLFQLPIPLLASFAALCGGLIARNFYFVLVSIAIYCLLWVTAFGYTKSILPELTYWDMFLPNSAAVLGSICAVGMGALVGCGLDRAYSRYRKAA